MCENGEVRDKLSEKAIYINADLDYDKLLVEFKNDKIDNIQNTFMNSKKFNRINVNKYKNNKKMNMNKLIKNYYVERLFFKINSFLNHNNKYAQIKKVNIRALNELSAIEQRKTAQRDITDETLKFYIEKPSPYIRLAVDNIQSRIIIYLDVEVVYKDNQQDKIPLKQQFKQKLGCIQRANTIDGILHGLVGDNYRKNLLENKMRNKTYKSAPSVTKSPVSLKQSTYQSGGKNTKTKKRTHTKKGIKKTLKKLIAYYSIL